MGSQAWLRMDMARAAFARFFRHAPQAICDAPGRVNLIGDHIDYAGGSVLPLAIQFGIAVATAQVPAPDGSGGRELVTAEDSPVQPDSVQLETARRLVSDLTRGIAGGGSWRFAVWADLPIGSGLSSSAALGVAIAGAVASAAGCTISPLDLCQLCRGAEEAVSGVQCGLMDHYASVFGRSGHAVHFGTVSLTHEHVPFNLPGMLLAVVESGQPRRLAASGYNERRGELARRQRNRVRHVQTEKKRVIAAVRALKAGDAQLLGTLMNASQASLRDDYEVSTPEIDLLCELLFSHRLAHGARLTGAGFGGSVVALLKRDAVQPGCIGECAVELTLREYERRTGLHPQLRLVEPSDGAMIAVDGNEPRLLHDWQEPARAARHPAPQVLTEPVEAPA